MFGAMPMLRGHGRTALPESTAQPSDSAGSPTHQEDWLWTAAAGGA